MAKRIARPALADESNARRQAAYRARHLRKGGPSARLNIVISAEAKAAIDRVAERHGLTLRAMVERLISDADTGKPPKK